MNPAKFLQKPYREDTYGLVFIFNDGDGQPIDVVNTWDEVVLRVFASGKESNPVFTLSLEDGFTLTDTNTLTGEYNPARTTQIFGGAYYYELRVTAGTREETLLADRVVVRGVKDGSGQEEAALEFFIDLTTYEVTFQIADSAALALQALAEMDDIQSNLEGSLSAHRITDPANIKEVDVFVAYGQSNSAGGLNISNGDPFEVPQGWGYKWDFPDNAGGGIQHLEDPTRRDGQQKVSAWPAFGFQWALTSGRPAVIVSMGQGGRTAKELEPESEGGAGWFEDMIEETDNCIQALVSEGFQVNSLAMMWCQGEADVDDGTPSQDYIDSVDNIDQTFHDHFSLDFDTEFYISKVGPRLTSTDTEYRQDYDRLSGLQVEATRTRDRWSVVFDLATKFTIENGLMVVGGVHYSQEGYDLMGIEHAKNIDTQRRFGTIKHLMLKRNENGENKNGALSKTGSEITFFNDSVWGSPENPLTGSITHNLVNAVPGKVQKIYHQDNELVLPAEWINLSPVPYEPGYLHTLKAEYVNNQRIEVTDMRSSFYSFAIGQIPRHKLLFNNYKNLVHIDGGQIINEQKVREMIEFQQEYGLFGVNTAPWAGVKLRESAGQFFVEKAYSMSAYTGSTFFHPGQVNETSQPARVGEEWVFDGVDDYIEVDTGDHPMTFTLFSGKITMAAETNYVLVINDSGSFNNSDARMGIATGSGGSFFNPIFEGDSWISGSAPAGRSAIVVIENGGPDRDIYVEGVLVATEASDLNPAGSSHIRVGGGINGVGASDGTLAGAQGLFLSALDSAQATELNDLL